MKLHLFLKLFSCYCPFFISAECFLNILARLLYTAYYLQPFRVLCLFDYFQGVLKVYICSHYLHEVCFLLPFVHIGLFQSYSWVLDHWVLFSCCLFSIYKRLYWYMCKVTDVLAAEFSVFSLQKMKGKGWICNLSQMGFLLVLSYISDILNCFHCEREKWRIIKRIWENAWTFQTDEVKKRGQTGGLPALKVSL